MPAPQKALDLIPADAVREMVGSLRELHDLGIPRTDEEVRERVASYFEFCEHSSIRPGIESLCLSLHITRTTLFRWARGDGCSLERQEMAQSAKQMCIAYIESATLSGRLNPASSIFALKNWGGYRDTVSWEDATPRKQDPYILSPEEIAKRIPNYIQEEEERKQRDLDEADE